MDTSLSIVAVISVVASLGVKLMFLVVGLTVVRRRNAKAGWLVVSSALISIVGTCLGWVGNIAGTRFIAPSTGDSSWSRSRRSVRSWLWW